MADDEQSLTSAAFEGLNRGDAAAARDLFRRAVACGNAAASTWFGLAVAQRQLGATADELAALDQALARDANHLPALIGKGDLYIRQGDERSALAFYGAAIRAASKLASLPAEWRAQVERVAAARRGLARKFETQLLAALAERGMGEPGTERVSHAIDLLLGKRQLYLQQPKYFFFPELPQIQFFDRRDFAWTRGLERQTDAIRTELRALLAADAAFVPYLQRDPHRPVRSDPNPLLDSKDWGAFYLIKDGVEVPENAARCPRTMATLAEVPLCQISGRTPSVLFSLLRPGTRIRPHSGFMNARLICHLPLIVPSNCGLRVGNETRSWREGEVVMFDDSMEHEAWNLSSEKRVVLIFDVWRPELSAKEQSLVAAILETAAGRLGETQAWSD